MHYNTTVESLQLHVQLALFTDRSTLNFRYGNRFILIISLAVIHFRIFSSPVRYLKT
jgi:hypothetical protein